MSPFVIIRDKSAPWNAKQMIRETIPKMNPGDSFLAVGVCPKSARTYVSALSPRGTRFVTRTEGEWVRVWRLR